MPEPARKLVPMGPLTPRDSRIAYYNAIKHLMQSYGVPVEENLDYYEERNPDLPYAGSYAAGQKAVTVPFFGDVVRPGRNSAIHLAPQVWKDVADPRWTQDYATAVLTHEMGHSSRGDRGTNRRQGAIQEARATALEQVLTPLLMRNAPGHVRAGGDFANIEREHPYRQAFGNAFIDRYVAEAKSKLGANLYPGRS